MALLWPGYVYWARGQVKQAVAAFQHAISQLECPEDPVTLGKDLSMQQWYMKVSTAIEMHAFHLGGAVCTDIHCTYCHIQYVH